MPAPRERSDELGGRSKVMCRYSTGCTIHTELLSMLLCASVSEAEFASSQKRSYKRFVVSWFTAASRFGYPIYVQHNIFMVYHSLRTFKGVLREAEAETKHCSLSHRQRPVAGGNRLKANELGFTVTTDCATCL